MSKTIRNEKPWNFEAYAPKPKKKTRNELKEYVFPLPTAVCLLPTL